MNENITLMKERLKAYKSLKEDREILILEIKAANEAKNMDLLNERAAELSRVNDALARGFSDTQMAEFESYLSSLDEYNRNNEALRTLRELSEQELSENQITHQAELDRVRKAIRHIKDKSDREYASTDVEFVNVIDFRGKERTILTSRANEFARITERLVNLRNSNQYQINQMAGLGPDRAEETLIEEQRVIRDASTQALTLADKPARIEKISGKGEIILVAPKYADELDKLLQQETQLRHSVKASRNATLETDSSLSEDYQQITVRQAQLETILENQYKVVTESIEAVPNEEIKTDPVVEETFIASEINPVEIEDVPEVDAYESLSTQEKMDLTTERLRKIESLVREHAFKSKKEQNAYKGQIRIVRIGNERFVVPLIKMGEENRASLSDYYYKTVAEQKELKKQLALETASSIEIPQPKDVETNATEEIDPASISLDNPENDRLAREALQSIFNKNKPEPDKIEDVVEAISPAEKITKSKKSKPSMWEKLKNASRKLKIGLTAAILAIVLMVSSIVGINISNNKDKTPIVNNPAYEDVMNNTENPDIIELNENNDTSLQTGDLGENAVSEDETSNQEDLDEEKEVSLNTGVNTENPDTAELNENNDTSLQTGNLGENAVSEGETSNQEGLEEEVSLNTENPDTPVLNEGTEVNEVVQNSSSDYSNIIELGSVITVDDNVKIYKQASHARDNIEPYRIYFNSDRMEALRAEGNDPQWIVTGIMYELNGEIKSLLITSENLEEKQAYLHAQGAKVVSYLTSVMGHPKEGKPTGFLRPEDVKLYSSLAVESQGMGMN